MNVLVIIGNDLNLNSSANLCHIAYLKGLNLNKANVTVLTVQHENNTNENTELPKENFNYVYLKKGNVVDALSLFVKNTFFKNKIQNNVVVKESEKKSETASKVSFLKGIKKKLLNDIYYVDWSWIKRASKFNSKDEFDYVISISTPHASHKAACNLIERKRIKYKKYVQIWEDPWTGDLFFNQEDREKFEREENELLNYADSIYYVSPVTYKYQKERFASNADKMKWMPLPYYYTDYTEQNYSKYNFGYFGDFYPHVRNIKPLYDAFCNLDYSLTVCGNPEKYLESINNIRIFGRMPVKQLKEYEDNTNVLVFICNLYGGQIPGKIYQYSATNKKILFILDGKDDEIEIIKNYFDKFKRYYFCKNDEKSITSAIQQMVENEDNIDSKVVEYFSPQNIVKNILLDKNEDESK